MGREALRERLRTLRLHSVQGRRSCKIAERAALLALSAGELRNSKLDLRPQHVVAARQTRKCPLAPRLASCSRRWRAASLAVAASATLSVGGTSLHGLRAACTKSAANNGVMCHQPIGRSPQLLGLR